MNIHTPVLGLWTHPLPLPPGMDIRAEVSSSIPLLPINKDGMTATFHLQVDKYGFALAMSIEI